MSYRANPNFPQAVWLCDIKPNPNNPRKFIDEEQLAPLIKAYKAWLATKTHNLPPEPVLRIVDGELQLISGERRIDAARRAGCTWMYAFVREMSDAEALNAMHVANEFEPITTAELAYNAAQLEQQGFSYEQIREVLNGASPSRYIVVGNLLQGLTFSDDAKLCDPGITDWYEAALTGIEHFEWCFSNWNLGLWDQRLCSKNFKKHSRENLPLDNTEKGLRITTDNDILRVRGALDLSLLTTQEVSQIAAKFIADLKAAVLTAIITQSFGPKNVTNYNPDTL